MFTKLVDRSPSSRWRSALASVVLHGVLLGLLLLGDSGGGPVGVAGSSGGALSVLEVGLVSLPGEPGRTAAPQVQDALAEEPLSEQKQQTESAVVPEDAIPLRIERLQKNKQQATRPRQPAQIQRPQQNPVVGGTASQHAGEGGLGTPAAPGAIAGDGRPFGFSLGDVSDKPKVIKSVQVVYPAEARKKGITGQVLARFHLDENGTVSHLHIKRAEPPDIFNHNTLSAIRQWRFQPAVHNNKAVPVWVELPVEFELR